MPIPTPERPAPAVGQLWQTTGNWGKRVEVMGLVEKQYPAGPRPAVQIASYPARTSTRGTRKGLHIVDARRFAKSADKNTDQGFIFLRML